MGELIVNGIKWGLRITLMATFLVAINALIGLITEVIFANVIGELLGILSMCVPFDLSAVMSAIGVAVSAILAFLISQKIYSLTIVQTN